MLHRTPAALIEARRFTAPGAGMIVHSFSATRRWQEDFTAFAGLFPKDPASNGIALTLKWVTSPLPYFS
nr:hypothetical protein [Oceaniglobus ichthyenteri]